MTDTHTTKWPTILGGMPPFVDHPDRACAGKDTRLWFPEGGSNGSQAVAVCRECPLIDDCAAWALRQPRLCGVWGGLTEAARDRARRGVTSPRGTFRPTGAGRRAGTPGAAMQTIRAKVAAMRADGHSVAEIADRIGFSHRTVQRHLRALGQTQDSGRRAVAA